MPMLASGVAVMVRRRSMQMDVWAKIMADRFLAAVAVRQRSRRRQQQARQQQQSENLSEHVAPQMG
jgi:hypothetical protein